MSVDTTEYDPFDAPLDAEEEQDSLVASLRILRGFGLFFAVTNSAIERNRRMDAVELQVPDKKIQRVAVNTETENLLWHLREVLTDPKPDGVFVYGLENWISGSVRPRSIYFLLNLNAARDSFPLLLPAPLVFWIPQYVLKAIAEAAPDFFSVRSGVYTFPIDPQEREEMSKILTRLALPEHMGSPLLERMERIHECEGLLAEYRGLVKNERNPVYEARLMSRLGLLIEAEGRYAEAETLFKEALDICREFSPYPSIDIGAALNNLAKIYMIQGKYSQSEPLFQEALDISRSIFPHLHSDTATVLNNIGSLYKSSNRLHDAETMYNEALSIRRGLKSYPEYDILPVLNNLSSLYMTQGRISEAEKLQVEAVKISRSTLSYPHVGIAASINNLAINYHMQGRYYEALELYDESLQILQMSLDNNHPHIKTAKKNINSLIRKIMAPGRSGEVVAKQLLPMQLPIKRSRKSSK